jgi:hypothetical protein
VAALGRAAPVTFGLVAAFGVGLGLGFAGAVGLLAPPLSRLALRRCGRDRGSEDSTSLPSDPFDMRA